MRPRLPIEVGADLPHLPPEHRLQPLVTAYSGRRGSLPPSDEDAPLEGAYWPASFFGLQRVARFRAATEDEQRAVLRACAQGLLGEAYAVEKMGLAYCARLGLLADNAEERMYYAHVGADEAAHLRWIAPYVEDRAAAVTGPFVDWVERLVGQRSRMPLVFLMQVMLEGWGLTHYRRLTVGCEAPALKARLRRVHRDEAAHHGGGRVLFDAGALDADELERLRDDLGAFLAMVRTGPQAVVAALGCIGPMGLDEKAETFEVLDARGHSAERLALLRDLMTGHGLDALIADLARSDAFEPLDPEACAAVSG